MLTPETIRSFLDAPRKRASMPEQQWFDTAPSLILEPTPDFSASVANHVAVLVNGYPSEYVQHLILEMLRSDNNPGSLKELRHMRKVLMIGRDSLRLATTTLEEEWPLKGVGRLISKLGKIVDGVEGGNDVFEVSMSAVRLNNKLAQSGDHEIGALESNEAIQMRIRSALAAGRYLTSYSEHTHEDIDEQRYHHARRLFRSVVHLGITSAILYPDSDKATYVREGIEMSAQYGENHDKLLLG